MSPESLGKKVFFIYPHSVIQNQLIQEMVDREFEIYFLHDHSKVLSVCETYESPIIFINIDEGLQEPQWEKLIRTIMEKEETNHAMIGILTYNDNSLLAQKYLMDLMVPCGFIKLKLGVIDSTAIIIKTLEANEVKGKRKFVRAKCNADEATLNVTLQKSLQKGTIIDISSVGMAVQFEKDIKIEKNSYLKDIQLKLRGILLHVSAVVIGHREDSENKTIYVLLFDQYVTEQIKSKLKSYINRTLQHEMERKLKIR
jgi:hypothetical protein